MPIKSAVIVGAGMAGLTTALALAHQGMDCDIFEQAPQLGEVGAGLQISPNASRILETLGVLPDLERQWIEPTGIGLVSGTTLKSLAELPAGTFARNRWQAPYGVMHRSTLQQALLAAVLRNPRCRLHLGARIEASPDAITMPSATLSSGERPELVIGADGVWSRIRDNVPDAPRIRFSGNIAWRFTIEAAEAPSFLDSNRVTAFLGPGAHLVAYPLKEIDGFNLVAIAAGVDPGRNWSFQGNDGQRLAMIRQFAGWDRRIADLVAKVEHPNFWPLYEAGAGQWQNGRDTVLVGDAAHAMMPFAAQGAAMAIEDGFELAALVATQPLPEALHAYQRKRQARAARVRDRGAFNKFAYHARGPVRFARDIVLSLRPPESLAKDLDWLYGYRAGS